MTVEPDTIRRGPNGETLINFRVRPVGSRDSHELEGYAVTDRRGIVKARFERYDHDGLPGASQAAREHALALDRDTVKA